MCFAMLPRIQLLDVQVRPVHAALCCAGSGVHIVRAVLRCHSVPPSSRPSAASPFPALHQQTKPSAEVAAAGPAGHPARRARAAAAHRGCDQVPVRGAVLGRRRPRGAPNCRCCAGCFVGCLCAVPCTAAASRYFSPASPHHLPGPRRPPTLSHAGLHAPSALALLRHGAWQVSRGAGRVRRLWPARQAGRRQPRAAARARRHARPGERWMGLRLALLLALPPACPSVLRVFPSARHNLPPSLPPNRRRRSWRRSCACWRRRGWST